MASRQLADRAGAQRAIAEAVQRVERDLPVATAPLAAIVGDELQGEYAALTDALASRESLREALAARGSDPLSARVAVATAVEAKGLEYGDIVLYRFVSANRQAYAEIAEGVSESDVGAETLGRPGKFVDQVDGQ